MQQVAQQVAQDLIARLPAELRIHIYYLVVPQVRTVALDTSKPGLFICKHSLTETNTAIRREFLAQVYQLHRARTYIVEIKDFDFGRFMHHLRRNDRLTVNNVRLRIRLSVSGPAIDAGKLLKWLEFARKHSLILRYCTWELPPVAVRREFMRQIFRMWEDLRGAYNELDPLTSAFRRWWNRGKGEMKDARPGERPPGGDDWERSAGTDVDSHGPDP